MKFTKGDSVIVKYLPDLGILDTTGGSLIKTVSLQKCIVEGFMSFYPRNTWYKLKPKDERLVGIFESCCFKDEWLDSAPPVKALFLPEQEAIFEFIM